MQHSGNRRRSLWSRHEFLNLEYLNLASADARETIPFNPIPYHSHEITLKGVSLF